MKIADALLLQRDLAEEANRLRELARQDSWRFGTRGAGEELKPAFDLEENHQRIRKLTSMSRKLSRAVAIANNTVELPDIKDDDYKEWM